VLLLIITFNFLPDVDPKCTLSLNRGYCGGAFDKCYFGTISWKCEAFKLTGVAVMPTNSILKMIANQNVSKDIKVEPI
jgi:hypothetical protein